MSLYKVSIVILTFNGLLYLREVLPMIANIQHLHGYEVIIIDNGSTDGTKEFVSSYPGIKFIENGSNLGYGKGKNIGVAAATGDYILLLDDDIFIHDEDIIDKLVAQLTPDTAFIQVPLLDKGSNSTKYYGIYFGVYGAISHHPIISIERILKYPSTLVLIGAPTGASLFFRKSVWNRLGGFDESQPFNLDDIDIGPRAWVHGYSNKLYTKTYFTHLGINKTTKVDVYALRFRYHFSGHIRAMLKNYAVYRLLTMIPAFCLYSFMKAIKFSFLKKSPRVMFALFASVISSLRSFPDTLRARKVVQAHREGIDQALFSLKVPRY